MSVKTTTTDELRRMNATEGLILQGCGGPLDEWVDGISKLLTEEGILLEGDTFKEVSVFEHDGMTNLLFSLEKVKLDWSKLAMWRLQSHSQFGGTWLSDYVPNKLGDFVTRQDSNTANGRDDLMLIINAQRNGYAPDQCGKTMTVGELRRLLEDFDPDEKIYLSHDNGYTYGSISQGDFEEREEMDEDIDEDCDEDMEMNL